MRVNWHIKYVTAGINLTHEHMCTRGSMIALSVPRGPKFGQNHKSVNLVHIEK